MSNNINTKALQNWDGYGRNGQAAYDRLFQWEQRHSELMDIINDYSGEYSEEEIEAARIELETYK